MIMVGKERYWNRKQKERKGKTKLLENKIKKKKRRNGKKCSKRRVEYACIEQKVTCDGQSSCEHPFSYVVFHNSSAVRTGPCHQSGDRAQQSLYEELVLVESAS